MEELCFCIRENAFLLDISLMNDRLVGWVERECGLKDLARALYRLVHEGGSLSVFAGTILRYTGFYGTDIIDETEQVLKKGAGLSSVEKRKSQIDYLVKKKKYLAAIHGYDLLLEKWGDMEKENTRTPANVTKAAILHNRGTAYVGLMLYRQAAENFLAAYETGGDDGDYRDYLASMRMELSENEYVAFAAEHTENYQAALDLEKRMEELTQEWEQQPEYLRLYRRQELRNGTDRQKYYEENEILTQALKSSYCRSVKD